tara:strand:+ start:215 stop:442 length:228 start_codon:yes stop_codon:yes gene_type:complete
MKVKELIEILKAYGEDTQVIVPDGVFYHEMTENEMQEVYLYKSKELGVTEFANENASKEEQELKTFLLIGTNQFS